MSDSQSRRAHHHNVLAKQRAVFLDRDGVITKERPDYVKSVEEMELLPGVTSALARLQEHGFKLIIVTNQSAVNRGLLTPRMLSAIHHELTARLEMGGVRIEAIYYCPHRPEEGCLCRKPQPGLLLRAAEELEIDLHRSWMIGDKEVDIQAGESAGCRVLRVRTNQSYALRVAVSELLLTERTRRRSIK